jgi:2-keto-3-deoxy-L-rhamnonate aldolase RhmA
MRGRELREALHYGQRVYGTCVTSPSPRWPAMIAELGLDFVFIDTEHVPLGREAVAWMCQAYRALGMTPIVRVPKPDPYQACMVLDAGACGVVFPYVESVEEVQSLRGAVRFRPLKGRSLQRALSGAEVLNEATSKYLEAFNEDNLMVVNIESIAAMEALDQILAVPGVDALLVGPHDLSINLGVPEQWSCKLFRDAISLIIRKAREKNVGVGIHFSWGLEPQLSWAKEGANLILNTADMKSTKDALGSDFTSFRSTLGDAPAERSAHRPSLEVKV